MYSGDTKNAEIYALLRKMAEQLTFDAGVYMAYGHNAKTPEKRDAYFKETMCCVHLATLARNACMVAGVYSKSGPGEVDAPPPAAATAAQTKDGTQVVE